MKTFSEWIISEVEKVGITAANPNAPATNQPSAQQPVNIPSAEEEAKKIKAAQKKIEDLKKKMALAARKDMQAGSNTNPHQNLQSVVNTQNPDDKAALLNYLQALSTQR